MIIIYFILFILFIYVLLSLFVFLMLIKRRGNKSNAYAAKLDNLLDESKRRIRDDNLNAYKSNSILQEFIVIQKHKIYCELTKATLNTKKTVICLHGYQSDGRKFMSNFYSCYHKDYLMYNICIFDFYGCGKSSGKLQFVGVKVDKIIGETIKLVHKWIGDDAEIFLHGVSLGAYDALGFLVRNPDCGVKGLIFDSGFINPYKQILYLARNKISILFIPLFPVWYRLFFGRWYKQDTVDNLLKRMDIPIMIIHGGNDSIVPQLNAQKLFDLWPSYKQIVIVQNALHGQACIYACEEYYFKLKRFVSNQHFNRVALIGVMGAGKTTIGAMLAKKYNIVFFDIDAEIVKDTNKQLTELFAESENEFRLMEIDKLAKISSFDNIVLSCGGGTPQIIGSNKFLREWTIIHLKIPPETAFKRSNGIKLFARPWDGFKKLCEERIPLYDRISDFVIVADNDIKTVFLQLCELIEKHNLLKDKGNDE